MHYVSLSYGYDPTFNAPLPWLERVRAYGGVLSALAKHGKVSHIVQIDYEGVYAHEGVDYHFVNYGDDLALFPNRLHQLVKSLKPDVVIVHSFNYPLQVKQLRLALSFSMPIIVQNHAEKPAFGARKILQRIADKWIDAYFFASRSMGLDWVTKGNLSSPNKIHEVMELSSIFYPIDRAEARAETGIDAEKAYLWAGRLDENKDPITAIKAFLKFAETTPGARLYMLYHEHEILSQVEQLLSQAPNADAIKLVGKIPNDDMLYWFNSVDFFIAASYYEGSGTAVCEAMSCGCIPVISDIHSFRMITDNGNIGLLFPPGNDEKLLAALHQTQMLDVAIEREKALAYFKSTLSFEAIAQKIHDIASSL
ncbi:glycosyltransferase family 4 protein [Mucilaginibacter sp. dw_454]|uniref:glycosyltransferase family 4 protein n=1 Tax=Mucilaginibacter sp. dw_454 TaxID=2720079 RepID=UPI001BD1DBE9|nr:glycosyltransferase family 4 protein [Mucilaginibacter sp. dw_454]